MTVASIAFYVFSIILIASATMVVSSRNPVHSVLFLILGFFNAAALFLLAGAEFLAMILVIVYVGAVAVLFLFVVMMLDIDTAARREGLQRYAPIGAAVGVVLLLELGAVLGGWKFAPDSMSLRLSPNVVGIHNTAQLGRLIYTDYVFLFQAAGLILLVAMIGAIVLTLRDRGERPQAASRRQNIANQVARRPADTLVMVDVASDTGIGGVLRPMVVLRSLPREDDHAGDDHVSLHDEAGHDGDNVTETHGAH